MGLGLDWRLRIWSGRSGDAPGWRNKLTDDFGERFRKDRESVRLDKQLEAHKQQVIEGGQGEIWNSLRTTARDKVKEINGSDSLLQFSDNDVNEFTITYDRNGEQRKAKAAFRTSNHTVVVTIESGKGIAPRSYRIIARNNDATFSLNNLPQSSKGIIDEMLSDLLK
jgi:hypothetical protein